MASIRNIIRLLSFLLLHTLSLVLAEGAPETIWGAVVFTIPGEAHITDPSTANSFRSNFKSLSSTGATQAFLAGQTIRRRYIDGKQDNITSVHRIDKLANNEAKDILDNRLVEVMSTDEATTVGSALAFMGGLYPPANVSGRDMYQYPAIKSVGKDDYNYNWLDGAASCAAHAVYRGGYTQTKSHNTTHNSTIDFYSSLSRFFPSYPASYMSYTNAPAIYEYAQYLGANNRTFQKSISSQDIKLLRSLASQHVWDNYGKYSSSKPIPVTGGKMLAGKVLEKLSAQVSGSSTSAPLTLLFGPPETMMAFFSVSGLAGTNEFHQLPLPGSQLVFEMYSNPEIVASPNSAGPRTVERVFVRSLFRNGTEKTNGLRKQSLFYAGGLGKGKGKDGGNTMSWHDWSTAMSKISISSPVEWCKQCGGEGSNVYCKGFLSSFPFNSTKDTKSGKDGKTGSKAPVSPGIGVSRNGGDAESRSQNCHSSNVVAGFIGAIIAVVLSVILGTLVVCCSGPAGCWKRHKELCESSHRDHQHGESKIRKGSWDWIPFHKKSGKINSKGDNGGGGVFERELDDMAVINIEAERIDGRVVRQSVENARSEGTIEPSVWRDRESLETVRGLGGRVYVNQFGRLSGDVEGREVVVRELV